MKIVLGLTLKKMNLNYVKAKKLNNLWIVQLEFRLEEENFLDVYHNKRKRMCILSTSDSENETSISNISRNVIGETEITIDGTQWIKLETGGSSGRPLTYTIFKDIAGPTSYAKKNIMPGYVNSTFELIIDRQMIQHIKDCTETEARQVLKKNWTVAQLHAFVAIPYARGAYEATALKASYLWSKKWGPTFFAKTMPRNQFMEILRFIRFDKKTQRSEKLCTDKFTLISETWNRFINNSQACYKLYENISIDEQLFLTKARCRFTQYMPNKPHKFGIKFWLAVDVKTKYILNSFPYLGKDET